MIIPVWLVATTALQCPAERASYALRSDPQTTAQFSAVDSGREWPAGLALTVRTGPSGLTSWWLPWLGGTDTLQHLASTTDVTAKGWTPPDPDDGPRPYGDREFIAFDAMYDVVELPRRGSPAPAHMLIPDAGAAHDRVFDQKQVFDLIGCARSD